MLIINATNLHGHGYTYSYKYREQLQPSLKNNDRPLQTFRKVGQLLPMSSHPIVHLGEHYMRKIMTKIYKLAQQGRHYIYSTYDMDITR